MIEKLVRNKIPEILDKKGIKYEVRIADDKEYWEFLKKKLVEETNEFVQNENKEELADILEVMYTICKFKGWDLKEIENIRKKKKEERGGFDKRIIIKIFK